VITGSGNGWGNTIIVDNDGSAGQGVTIIQGTRNGFGNRLIVRPGDGPVIDLSNTDEDLSQWLQWVLPPEVGGMPNAGGNAVPGNK